jgi:outer membrane protein TolC
MRMAVNRKMDSRFAKCAFFLAGFVWIHDLRAQNTPPSPSHPWHSRDEKSLDRQLLTDLQPKWDIDSRKLYTLSELIDLAELHNPNTRAVWERARVRAAELGVARSAYYPTLTAAVFGASIRQAALVGEFFHRQTIAVVQPSLQVEYLIFDLGSRAGEVDVAKANLIIANLEFNNTHRELIFDVTAAYFRLLNAKGQRESAEISLKNAQAIEADADSRLKNGLATRPDLLEATAARAQADYDFQATLGAEKIAQSELASLMGLPAETELHVQSISELPIPQAIANSLDDEIQRALRQRPELLVEIARIRSAKGLLKQARSTYFPTIRFVGNGGLARAYGQQDLYPGHYAEGNVWTAGLEMRWTLFNGAKREEQVIAAKAEERAAEARLNELRDQIDEEVFASYTNLQTALRQQLAAAALLAASSQSYEAARQSYDFGLRSQLDVISAQKAFAQASSEDVTARSQLLLQVADLAFRTADMIAAQSQHTNP